MTTRQGLTDDELRAIWEKKSDSETEIGNQEIADGDDMEDVAEESSDDENNVFTIEAVEDEVEISDSDIETNDPTDNLQYIAHDGTVWNKSQPPSSRIRSANVLRLAPGPTRYAIHHINQTPISALKLFITDEMLDLVLHETNRELRRVCSERNIRVNEISRDELEGYTPGLLLLAGVHKGAGESLIELWSDSDGRPIFRATMSLKRFCNISRSLRFDNKEDRAVRRRDDKLAPIRALFDLFVGQLLKMFVPYENLTVDEQLIPYRGKCPFRICIPTKPRGKYGIKLWLLCDVKTAYIYCAEVYTGKEENQPRQINLGRNVVLRLVKRIENTGRNITTDNFFTDYHLATELLKRNLTLIGTLRKNKTFIPAEFKSNRNREVCSSIFGFQHNMTLVSYTPKKNKSVLLLSSMYHDAKVSPEEHKKPVIILDYNKTEGGVDTADKLASTYRCKRGTRRWPVCLFYTLLDLAAINAYVVYMHINPSYNARKLHKRRLFLKELGYNLTEKCRNARLTTNIPAKIKIHAVAGTSGNQEASKKRGRCKDCGWKRDRKSNTKCQACNGFICPDPVNIFCKNCIE